MIKDFWDEPFYHIYKGWYGTNNRGDTWQKINKKDKHKYEATRYIK